MPSVAVVVWRRVHIRRRISTGLPARARSASCVSPGSKPARHRRASIRVWGGFATWVCCCMTRNGLRKSPNLPDDELVEGQRSIILDPHDPQVIAEAQRNGSFRRRDRIGSEFAGLQIREGVEDRVAAAHRIPHAADAVLRAADVARASQQAGRHDHSQQRELVPRHRRFPRADEVPREPVRCGTRRREFAMRSPSRKPCVGIVGRKRSAMSIANWRTACCGKQIAAAKKPTRFTT